MVLEKKNLGHFSKLRNLKSIGFLQDQPFFGGAFFSVHDLSRHSRHTHLDLFWCKFCWVGGGVKPTKCDSFKRPDQQRKYDSPQHQHHPQNQYHHHNQYHTRLNHCIPNRIRTESNHQKVSDSFSSLCYSYAFLSIVITFSVLGNTLDTIDGRRNPAPAYMKPNSKKNN